MSTTVIDYYKVIGVEPSASSDEIKKAYRKLASEFHPDRNSDPGASDKLKEINEAHDTLKDKTKRANYDDLRKYGDGPHFTRTNGPYTRNEYFSSTDLDDLFASFHAKQRRERAAQNNRFVVEITLEQAYAGTILNTRLGEVTVPAGIRTGTKIYINKHNAIVEIRIPHHRKFKRSKDDLLVELNINAFEAMLGTEATIAHLDGKQYKFKVPEGAQNEHVVKLSGKGMKNTETDRYGDLLIKFLISTPDDLTDSEKDVIINLNKVRKLNF